MTQWLKGSTAVPGKMAKLSESEYTCAIHDWAGTRALAGQAGGQTL